MEATPISMRKHISIIGKTNSGKSTLFNLLLGQDASIVSEISGTTTDPVIKTMELIPYGPIAVVDTAGLGDETELGEKRMEKTMALIKRSDLLLYVVEAMDKKPDINYEKPYILVYTKCELLGDNDLKNLKENNPDAVFLSNFGKDGMDELKGKIIERLSGAGEKEETLLGDLLPEKSTVLMVVPIDSAAPKGRLILPQVQLLRDCLDHNIKAYVVNEKTLEDALSDLKNIDLVVTDSQIFAFVDKVVPKGIKLTSFSMLMARQKGNFEQYLDGAKALLELKDGDNILILEGCTHNRTHEDIGRVKIPALIGEKTGAKCNFEFCSGYDFPKDVKKYKVALSCGMCMINKQEVSERMKTLKEAEIPIINYGVAIAALNGILDRTKEIFGV